MPEEEILGLWTGMKSLEPPTEQVENFQRFVDYLEHTWLGPSPLFSCALWNHYSSIKFRTTNHCEGIPYDLVDSILKFVF